jgi:CopG family nickel-responsive transcriptional regulator
MDKVARIGVSLEPDLLEAFDEYLIQRGYTTRSEAIRDLIKKAMVEESLKAVDSHAVGTITLVYDHNLGSVKENLMDIQHRNHDIISSSIHVHLDLEKCLEVLVIHGTVGKAQRLSEELTSVKGLLHSEPVMIAGELSEHGKKHVH